MFTPDQKHILLTLIDRDGDLHNIVNLDPSDIRPLYGQLKDAGLIRREYAQSPNFWSLTPAGKQELYGRKPVTLVA